LTLAWLHRTKVDSIVRFHYEHERPALANLDGLRRHERGVVEHVQNKTDQHKLRRPQGAIRVRRDAAGFHCSGTGLHCVVYEIKIAGTRRDRAVSQIGLHLHVWAAEIFSDERQIVFGHGEVGINRIEALTGDDRLSRGSKKIAYAKIAQSYSSVVGRFDVAIIKIYMICL